MFVPTFFFLDDYKFIHSHSYDFWSYSHEPGSGWGTTQAISLFLQSLCRVLLTLAWALDVEITSTPNIQHSFSLALDKTGSRAGIKVCDGSLIPFFRSQQRNSAVKLEQWRESQPFNSGILTVAVGGHFNSRAKAAESCSITYSISSHLQVPWIRNVVQVSKVVKTLLTRKMVLLYLIFQCFCS